MASQRIHGITVDLDVNTSGVSQSFSDINKSLRGSQQELKSVDRLLKQDVNNLTLLSQKQYLLTDAIDKTKDKLVQLAKAKRIADSDDSVDKSSKQYRELERDIARTKQQLEDLTDKQKQNNTQLENAQKSINGIGEAYKEVNNEGLKFGDIVKANLVSDAIINGAKALANAIKDIAVELNNWANDYRELEVYEKQFESNIRNTANASDEEIRSLKQLASAKERQGVISKRAITSAYQELATYVESTDAIEGLTDALLDMSAQQYGVDATEESVRNIATTLGKALANGDYSGLTRLGYGFTEAQKYVMEYGTELERVAVLNEVIGSSIGGMNEALAQTDEGKLFQFANVFDDAKESVGQLVSELEIRLLDTVMPEIETAISGLLTWLDGNKESLVGFVNNVAQFITSEDFKTFISDVGGVLTDVIEIGSTIIEIANDLGLVNDAWVIIKGTVEAVKSITKSLSDDIKMFKEGGIFARGKYIDEYWADKLGSGGFISSGGFNGMASGGTITLNNTFNIQNGSSINEATVMSWADVMIDRINNELGRMV